MAGYGFHRDIVNSELDIQVDSTVVATFSSTALTLPAGTISLAGRVAVEQTTSHTEAVTGANATSGTILLDNVDLAAAAEATFTVANTSVAANDIILLCVGDYVDAAAAPVVSIGTVADNTFSVILSNPSGTASFNACKLNFAVIKSVA